MKELKAGLGVFRCYQWICVQVLNTEGHNFWCSLELLRHRPGTLLIFVDDLKTFVDSFDFWQQHKIVLMVTEKSLIFVFRYN